MTGVVTAIRASCLTDNGYTPVAVWDEPVNFKEDFIGVGERTVVDAALANETDPFGWFYSGTANVTSGIWLVSHDAVVAATQLPTLQTGAAGANGVIAMTTDATADERISMQLNGAAFKLSVGAPMTFKCRCKFSAVTCDALIGLAVTGATDPHASRPAGFVAFTITSGSGALQTACADAGAATASAALTTATVIVADTYLVLAMHWDGIDSVDFYVNGTRKGTLVEGAAELPIDLVMSPVLCIESNGAAEVLSVDYVTVVGARA